MNEELLNNKKELAEKVEMVARQISIHEIENGHDVSPLNERIDMAMMLLSFKLYNKEQLTEEEMVTGSDIIRRVLVDYVEN